MRLNACGALDWVSIDWGATLRAEPAACGLPAFHMVADDLDDCGDGDRQDQAHATPHPSPEEDGNRERKRVEPHAPANECGNQQVGGDDMEQREHRANANERLDGVKLLEADE